MKRFYSILYRLTGWLFPDSYYYIRFGRGRVHIKLGLIWRRFLVSKFVDAGRNINIERCANINRNLKIGSNSSVGKKCGLGPDVIIGKDVMMGPEVIIYTRNHKTDRVDIPMRLQGFKEIQGVTIEDDVWIGRRVIILPGVRVGRGSVLAAGAVVTKDVPDFTIVAGNPAQVVKSRVKVLNER